MIQCGLLQSARDQRARLSVAGKQIDGRLGNLRRQTRVLRQEINLQNAQQHYDRSDQRVEKELDGRVEPVVAAPNSNQEIHWHQTDFKEQVEQEQIHRTEHTEHECL